MDELFVGVKKKEEGKDFFLEFVWCNDDVVRQILIFFIKIENFRGVRGGGDGDKS